MERKLFLWIIKKKLREVCELLFLVAIIARERLQKKVPGRLFLKVQF